MITALGSVLLVLTTTVGLQFLVVNIDKGAEQEDVQNG